MWDGIFVDEDGKVIGDDGINDGKVYLIKTTASEVGQDTRIPCIGISKSQRKATTNFIKTNSGNASVFKNSIAYTNSVEIEGNQDVRSQMVNIVNQDDGEGGTKPQNNREYGGKIREGKVIESPPGEVGNPETHSEVAIGHSGVQDTDVIFHSHPSGTVRVMPKNAQGVETNMSGTKQTFMWESAPSKQDLKRDIYKVDYMFSRRTNTVYVYNKNGVVATIPQENFVKPIEPKKKK